MQDPVFSGDKFEYLKLIPNLVNPTLKIPMLADYSENALYMASLKAIQQFLSSTEHLVEQSNPSEDDPKPSYFMKVAYTQHAIGYRGAKIWETSATSILNEVMRLAQDKEKSVYPYVMLQPFFSSYEYKIIVLNGVASHNVKATQKKNAKAFGTEQDRFLFAEQVVAAFQEACPHMLDNGKGLWRVDIIKDVEGNYLVNELEHMDALMCPSRPSSAKGEGSTAYSFLVDYWHQKLQELISLL